MTSAYDRVIAALQARGSRHSGQDWQCPGPLHHNGDRSPGLGVKQGDGRVLLLCQTGCATEDVVRALGLEMRDLFDESSAPKAKIIGFYTYQDENGSELFQVVRYEPKAFKQRRRGTTGEWIWKLGDVRRVPYRLPQLVAAPIDAVVYVAEGEKDVVSIVRVGGVATCSPGGASTNGQRPKWRDEYSQFFKGRRVVVVADKDSAGYAHARATARSIESVGSPASVALVEPAKGKDATDHLDAGLGLEDFVRVELEESEAQSVTESDDLLVSVASIPMENATFLWEPYIPLDNFTLLAGLGDLGKSHVSIDLAARTTRGELEGELAGKPGDVVIATAEDAFKQTVKPRLVAAGADLERVFLVRQDRAFSVPEDVDKLSREISERDARLLIIDPLVAYIGMKYDSHKDQHARSALAPLHALASEHDLAVVAIMHLNKASELKTLYERVSASGGFFNAARSVLLVAADPQDENMRVVAHGKHNLSLSGPSLSYRIEGVELDEVDPRSKERIRTSRLVWCGESSYSVLDLLKSAAAKPREEAMDWLEGALASGPQPVEWLEKQAAEEGHAWRTVRRASEELGVVKERSGFGPGGRSEWRLPRDPSP